MDRARQCGYSLFQHKGIESNDKEARLEHWCENYRFFGASTVILYYDLNYLITASLIWASFLSVSWKGLTNKVSLPAHKPLCIFPHLAQKHIKMLEDLSPLFGLSLGFEDKDGPVNDFRTDKLNFDEFVFWQD